MKKLLSMIIAGTGFIILTSCEQNELTPRPSGSVENVEYIRPQSPIDEDMREDLISNKSSIIFEYDERVNVPGN